MIEVRKEPDLRPAKPAEGVSLRLRWRVTRPSSPRHFLIISSTTPSWAPTRTHWTTADSWMRLQQILVIYSSARLHVISGDHPYAHHRLAS